MNLPEFHEFATIMKVQTSCGTPKMQSRGLGSPCPQASACSACFACSRKTACIASLGRSKHPGNHKARDLDFGAICGPLAWIVWVKTSRDGRCNKILLKLLLRMLKGLQGWLTLKLQMIVRKISMPGLTESWLFTHR